MALRTLLITPYLDAALPSGGVLFSIDCVREWLARGRCVAVLCGQRERDLGDLEPAVRAGRLLLHEVASPRDVRFTHHFHPHVYERARAAIDTFKPDVIHIHNTQGMLAAMQAGLDWRDGLAGRPQPCRALLTALDFGMICLNHYLFDGTDRPCAGPTSYRDCARCVRRSLHGAARWVGPALPRAVTRQLWPDFVRLDQMKSADALQRQMRAILRRLDSIIAPSPILAETLSAAAGLGVTVHPTGYGISPAKVLRPLKSKSDRARLAFLGSEEPVKGLDVLIAAAARLPDGLRLEIHAIGGTGVDRSIAAAPPAAGRYLRYSPAMMGRRLAQEHARIDAVLVPSLWHENSPFVVLESLANGTPVIASDAAGIRHLIRHEQTGLLLPPGSVEAWCSALQRCAREPHWLERLGASAEFTRTTAEFIDDIKPLEELPLGGVAGAGLNMRASDSHPSCMAETG